eukprot:scaffold4261_cov110-Isochrysis_galbana.AAC.10
MAHLPAQLPTESPTNAAGPLLPHCKPEIAHLHRGHRSAPVLEGPDPASRISLPQPCDVVGVNRDPELANETPAQHAGEARHGESRGTRSACAPPVTEGGFADAAAAAGGESQNRIGFVTRRPPRGTGGVCYFGYRRATENRLGLAGVRYFGRGAGGAHNRLALVRARAGGAARALPLLLPHGLCQRPGSETSRASCRSQPAARQAERGSRKERMRCHSSMGSFSYRGGASAVPSSTPGAGSATVEDPATHSRRWRRSLPEEDGCDSSSEPSPAGRSWRRSTCSGTPLADAWAVRSAFLRFCRTVISRLTLLRRLASSRLRPGRHLRSRSLQMAQPGSRHRQAGMDGSPDSSSSSVSSLVLACTMGSEGASFGPRRPSSTADQQRHGPSLIHGRAEGHCSCFLFREQGGAQHRVGLGVEALQPARAGAAPSTP